MFTFGVAFIVMPQQQTDSNSRGDKIFAHLFSVSTSDHATRIHKTKSFIVKLREREGQRVNQGRSLKGHLKMVDGGYPFPDALH